MKLRRSSVKFHNKLPSHSRNGRRLSAQEENILIFCLRYSNIVYFWAAIFWCAYRARFGKRRGYSRRHSSPCSRWPSSEPCAWEQQKQNQNRLTSLTHLQGGRISLFLCLSVGGRFCPHLEWEHGPVGPSSNLALLRPVGNTLFELRSIDRREILPHLLLHIYECPCKISARSINHSSNRTPPTAAEKRPSWRERPLCFADGTAKFYCSQVSHPFEGYHPVVACLFRTFYDVRYHWTPNESLPHYCFLTPTKSRRSIVPQLW